ncbi:hypothetical protein V8E51_007025 [Hyaloscypha variabilis]
MVATADPQDPKFLRPPRGQAENRLCMCWIPHRWWVQGSGWLQLATRHLRPALLPLSYEYLSMLEHRQPASFANTSSHHSYTTSNLLSQALDVRPSDRSNSNTPDILQHFLTYHIKYVQVPPSSSDQLTRRAAFLPLNSTRYHRARSKAEPTELYTPLPLHLQANPAAIGSCAAAHIPGRKACVSAGTFAPTAPREKHQGSCALASPPVGSLCLRNIPSAIAWDGGNARPMVQQWCGAAAGSRSRFLW